MSNSNNKLFISNGFYYKIELSDHESNESVTLRGWFIVNRNPKTYNEYIEAVQLSHIYANIVLYDCEYDIKIMKKMQQN